MCKECRKYPAFKEIGAIDCHYKIAGEFVAGIVGIMLFAALVFYAPALNGNGILDRYLRLWRFQQLV